MTSVNVDGFTTVQARVVSLLLDGTWHRQKEMLDAIDEQADTNTLKATVFRLKKVLEPRGEYIVTQRHPQYGTLYMMVRRLAPSDE